MRQGIGKYYQLTGNKVVFKPAVSINTMHDVLVCYTCVKKVISEEWQAKIQEHKKQNRMKAKKFGLLYAILMLTLTVSAQTGSISKIWLKHGVTENNSTGLRVHITVHTTGMKGIPARAIAYFDSPQGTGIKDLNGAYCTSSGTVCTSKDFTPSYTQCTYEDMGIFIPYEELHMSPGKRTYYCRVFLQNLNNNKFLCNSNFVSFTGTGASNQQAQQYPNNTPQGSFPNGKTLYLANAKKTSVVSAKFYYDNENDAICFLTHPYKPLYQGPGDTFILENRDSQGLHFREFKTEPLTTMMQVSPFGPPTPMYMGKVGKVKKNKTFVLSPNHTCITFLGLTSTYLSASRNITTYSSNKREEVVAEVMSPIQAGEAATAVQETEAEAATSRLPANIATERDDAAAATARGTNSIPIREKKTNARRASAMVDASIATARAVNDN